MDKQQVAGTFRRRSSARYSARVITMASKGHGRTLIITVGPT
jgi:hypothetical protein